MTDDIKEMTSTEVNQLLASWEYNGEYTPIGKFCNKENDVYVGLDNSDGCCWVEEFKTKRACFKWLRGE